MLTAAFLWHATSVYRGVEEGLQPDINIWTHLETIKFLYPVSLPYIKEFNSTSQQSVLYTVYIYIWSIHESQELYWLHVKTASSSSLSRLIITQNAVKISKIMSQHRMMKWYIQPCQTLLSCLYHMPHIVTLVKYIQSKQTKANCYNGEG